MRAAIRWMLVVVFIAGICINTAQCQQDPPLNGPKSTRAAWLWSGGATLLPPAAGIYLATRDSDTWKRIGGILIGSSALFGPGVGHAYAGRTGRMFGSAVLRAGCGVGALIVGVTAWESDFGTPQMVGVILFGVAYTYTILRDFGHLERSVERYNEAHRAKAISLYPAYFPRAGTMGFGARLSF